MRIRAWAKLNLTLEVLNRRSDGFHNLRTVFQTVSIADVLDVEATRARRSKIAVASDVEIPGENLVTRAADAVLSHTGATAAISIRLNKRIPMGAGMGGGSADAAAVLRSLPLLLTKRIADADLWELAAGLGSDVPYFLLGGAALGLGRGTEVYPLPELPALPVLVVAPPVHVSTAEAYRALQREADTKEAGNATARMAIAILSGTWQGLCQNDFEQAVFAAHPQLASIRQKLARAGAKVARMTGSGSAVFGVFDSVSRRDAAAAGFAGERVFAASFVSRRKLPVLTSKLSTRKGA